MTILRALLELLNCEYFLDYSHFAPCLTLSRNPANAHVCSDSWLCFRKKFEMLVFYFQNYFDYIYLD